MIATTKKNVGYIGNNDSALTPNLRIINGYGEYFGVIRALTGHIWILNYPFFRYSL